ncbi:hypothetical protein F383_10378 [Gossypium arboreum]|uniref:Uncharacterized protein n=1 Tax=Gossypium arboreum TaxID=29729 RepID=A0A0B0MWR4_GOSAR|nr:hypothetical protein F383_10378 [Gossypium arboreum]
MFLLCLIAQNEATKHVYCFVLLKLQVSINQRFHFVFSCVGPIRTSNLWRTCFAKLQSRKTCAIDSSSSPQSGHNASNLNFWNFRELRVGIKLFVILHRLILILLRTFNKFSSVLSILYFHFPAS